MNNYYVYFWFTDDQVMHRKNFKEDWSEVKKYLDGLLLFENLKRITVTRKLVSDKRLVWTKDNPQFTIVPRTKTRVVTH